MTESQKDALICSLGIAFFIVSLFTWMPRVIVWLGKLAGTI